MSEIGMEERKLTRSVFPKPKIPKVHVLPKKKGEREDKEKELTCSFRLTPTLTIPAPEAAAPWASWLQSATTPEGDMARRFSSPGACDRAVSWLVSR